jgi:hypothetical protein
LFGLYIQLEVELLSNSISLNVFFFGRGKLEADLVNEEIWLITPLLVVIIRAIDELAEDSIVFFLYLRNVVKRLKSVLS